MDLSLHCTIMIPSYRTINSTKKNTEIYSPLGTVYMPCRTHADMKPSDKTINSITELYLVYAWNNSVVTIDEHLHDNIFNK